jgi:hypothetical protein
MILPELLQIGHWSFDWSIVQCEGIMREMCLPYFITCLNHSVLCFTLNMDKIALDTGLMIEIMLFLEMMMVFILCLRVILVQLLLENVDIALQFRTVRAAVFFFQRFFRIFAIFR